MHDENRRNLLKSGGSVLAVGVLGSLASVARAAGEVTQTPMSESAVLISADREGICATCRPWGRCTSWASTPSPRASIRCPRCRWSASSSGLGSGRRSSR